MKRFAFVLGLLLWCSVAQAQTFQVASVTLTSAQIKALPSSSVPLVPAPALGQVIRLLWMSVSIKTAAVYGNIDPNGYIAIGTPALDEWYVALNDSFSGSPYLSAIIGNNTPTPYYLNASAPNQFSVQGWGIVPNLARHEWVDGQPIVIKSWNGLGNFTGGDPSDTLKITVYYTLEDL